MEGIQQTSFAKKLLDMEKRAAGRDLSTFSPLLARFEDAMRQSADERMSMCEPRLDKLPPNVKIVNRQRDIDTNDTDFANENCTDKSTVFAFESVANSSYVRRRKRIRPIRPTTTTAAMDRLNIETKKVDLEINDATPTETEDVESVYAFEGLNLPDVTDDTIGNGVEAEKRDEAEKVPSTMKTEPMEETCELFLLFCLTLNLAGLALICYLWDRVEIACVFVAPAVLFLCCFVYNYVDDLRMKVLQHRLDVQWAKSARLITETEVNATEADEANDDVASVYAFDAVKAEEVMDVTESADTTEGNSPFGFNVPNPGLSSAYHCETKDYCFVLNKTVTTFLVKATSEHMFLHFEDKNLKAVEHAAKKYHSFAALPTKVADLLVSARVEIIRLKHFW